MYHCTSVNCLKLEENGETAQSCSDPGIPDHMQPLWSVVYRGEQQETSRPAGEHLRYATNPDTCPATGSKFFLCTIASSTLETVRHGPQVLLMIERNNVVRKVFDPMYIFDLKPAMNDKEEMKVLSK